MEQDQSIRFIATLVDSMVKEVTARVTTSLLEEKKFLQLAHEALDNDETFWHRITKHVVLRMDEQLENEIETWIDSNLEGKIDHYMSNSFEIADHFDISNYEDSIKEYAKEAFHEQDEDSMHDKVREIVSDMTFEVTVN